jgi:glyoxylase-like metal-dependent hydrolase (beta-lactamase superfamily II)
MFRLRAKAIGHPVFILCRLGSLRVIAAPGHTPDQIAFLDERDGTLIAGDAFQTAAGTAVAGVTRWLFPFPALATWI